MSLWLWVVLLVLVIVLILTLPPLAFHAYGWAPSAIATVLLVVVLVVWLFRVP